MILIYHQRETLMYFVVLIGLIMPAAGQSDHVRLVASCKTSLGSGRCTNSEKACRQLGGIVADAIALATLPKENWACDRGEECCVLLPIPEDDKCTFCGIPGSSNDALQEEEDGLQVAGVSIPTNSLASASAFPQRILPNFDAVRWTRWRARSFDEDVNVDAADGLQVQVPQQRLSRLSKLNKWCWQVVITDGNGTILGSGALIDGRNVLTLAHVVAGRRAQDVTVILGASDFLRPWNTASEAIWSVSPKQILLHEQFNQLNFQNDLAVLRIPLAPCNQGNICPICLNDLPAGASLFSDHVDRCFITAWDAADSLGFATSLRETGVHIVETSNCFHSLNELGVVGFNIPDSLFCAQTLKQTLRPPLRTCETDTGAPLVCLAGDKRWYLRGLITLTTEACTLESSKPFLLTDTGMLFSWIKIKASTQDPLLLHLPTMPVPNRQLIRNDNALIPDPQYAQQMVSMPRSFLQDYPFSMQEPWLQLV